MTLCIFGGFFPYTSHNDTANSAAAAFTGQSAALSGFSRATTLHFVSIQRR